MAQRSAMRRWRQRRCRSMATTARIPTWSPMPGARGTRRCRLGEEHGYRNAQATVIAPTGTIGLVMDCDTTGIEPDFRAGQVQETGGRRLLQDHQPGRSGSAAVARLRGSRNRGHHRLRGRPRHAANRAGINHDRPPEPRVSAQRRSTSIEAGLASAFDIKFVFNKYTLGEEFCRTVLNLGDAELDDLSFDLLRASGLFQSGHRQRQHPRVRRHDNRGCAASHVRSLRRVRLRQSVRTSGQTLLVGRKPHPDDGGGTTVHLGRHLQDHQHAERGDGGAVSRRLHDVLEARAQGQCALSRRVETLPAAVGPAPRGGHRGG